jgi:hypothetical protein
MSSNQIPGELGRAAKASEMFHAGDRLGSGPQTTNFGTAPNDKLGTAPNDKLGAAIEAVSILTNE